MENNKVNFAPVLNILFMVCGAILMLAGITLIILKMFGYPFLFEGVTAFFMGGIAIYVARFQMMMIAAIDGFTNIIDGLAKKAAAAQMGSMFGGGRFPGMSDANTMRVEIDENTSPEQLEALKKRFPFMEAVIDAMSTTFNKDNLENMSLVQLEKELKKAIDNDLYEKAAVLRDLIAKKKAQ